MVEVEFIGSMETQVRRVVEKHSSYQKYLAIAFASIFFTSSASLALASPEFEEPSSFSSLSTSSSYESYVSTELENSSSYYSSSSSGYPSGSNSACDPGPKFDTTQTGAGTEEDPEITHEYRGELLTIYEFAESWGWKQPGLRTQKLSTSKYEWDEITCAYSTEVSFQDEQTEELIFSTATEMSDPSTHYVYYFELYDTPWVGGGIAAIPSVSYIDTYISKYALYNKTTNPLGSPEQTHPTQWVLSVVESHTNDLITLEKNGYTEEYDYQGSIDSPTECRYNKTVYQGHTSQVDPSSYDNCGEQINVETEYYIDTDGEEVATSTEDEGIQSDIDQTVETSQEETEDPQCTLDGYRLFDLGMIALQAIDENNLSIMEISSSIEELRGRINQLDERLAQLELEGDPYGYAVPTNREKNDLESRTDTLNTQSTNTARLSWPYIFEVSGYQEQLLGISGCESQAQELLNRLRELVVN